jgi:hypothetical protein
LPTPLGRFLDAFGLGRRQSRLYRNWVGKLGPPVDRLVLGASEADLAVSRVLPRL